MLDIKRASIYCRGSDLAFQAGIAAAFITDHQLECWNIYVDEQGIDSWQKLTADCARGYTDVIIIKSIDVITEDMKGIALLDDLLPVPIIGAEDLYCTKENLNLETLQYEKPKRSRTKEQRQELSDYRQANPKFETEERYYGGIAPFGYSRVDDKLIRDPLTAPFVEQLFIKARDGEKITDIAVWLSNEGIPTPRGGSRWSENTVRDILKNSVYADDLISRELYETVQERFDSKAEPEKRPPGFYQGIVTCSVCGRPLAYHGTGGKDRRKTAVYSCKYHTGKSPQEEPLPHMPKIDEETLKSEVLEQCNEYIREMTSKTKAKKMEMAINRFEKEKNRYEGQITKLGQKILERSSVYGIKIPDNLWNSWETARRKYLTASAQRYLLLHRFGIYRPEEMTENDYEQEKKLYQSITVSPEGKAEVHFWGETAFQ